jgi:hypothetical protein
VRGFQNLLHDGGQAVADRDEDHARRGQRQVMTEPVAEPRVVRSGTAKRSQSGQREKHPARWITGLAPRHDEPEEYHRQQNDGDREILAGAGPAHRVAMPSGVSTAPRTIASTKSDHAATAGAAVRDRRPAVPAVTGACPGWWLRSPPAERNATPGSFRERYGSERQVHDYWLGSERGMARSANEEA